MQNSITYCNNGNFDEDDDCIICPHNSICKKGHIHDCANDFELIHGEICLNPSQFESLTLEMMHSVLELSSLLNGHNMCYEQSNHN